MNVFRIVTLLLFFYCFLNTMAYARIEISTHDTDKGYSYVIMSGTFEASDDLREIEKVIILKSPSFVIFDSDGGNVFKAMEYGRTIRRYGLDTLQVRTMLCASACSLAFMGGKKRLAEVGSIGLHQSSFTEGTFNSSQESVAAVQHATAAIIKYMVEMGVDPSVLELALDYKADDMRYLSKSEMVHYNIINPRPHRTTKRRPKQNDKPNEPKALLSGITRHPSNEITMRAGPNRDSSKIQVFQNGNPVKILAENGRWYFAKIRNKKGYIHSTTVKVDQFIDVGFDRKFIQIRSFKTKKALNKFIRTSKRKISVFLSTNGWYAVTLKGTFKDKRAATLMGILKSSGKIPKDSFKTFGNTYVKKVCCN